MRTVAVVPMKLNNERLPQKNTKRFDNGKPLCYYILNTLLKVEGIDQIYVYCSNPKIKDYIPSGIKYLKRKESLDTSQTPINEVLKCFAEDVHADIYLMTHATAPFVTAESMQESLEAVKSENYDSALAVQKVQEFLWKDGKPFNYDLSNIPRTQDLPVIYSETSGFYIYRKEIILKHNRRIGFKSYLKEVSKIESIDIDEYDDFEIANSIFNMVILKNKRGNI
ncbi:acylneuraminate cytidylyltransferase family protein [Clostridium sp. SHJSY1]|uniref:acylneuraminate cytidylyltransferase family protein n=1 Tax=Clostridium sp. SHJSY1 TaxID=2942483 RepID=UPI00287671E7|nr:acylneuraminate cytidylyltransferase family protein [Clostridium sp. SHJSY1]MDS0526530.1 acylneuraminate cytidylyltransferase family protein [Clostridium sp. SHJSY1]